MIMKILIIFGIISLLITTISWRTLFNTKSHGFYRFFSWECMAWLVATNYKFWFTNPFSANQIISWIFLIYAAYLALAGVFIMKVKGKAEKSKERENLFGFEKDWHCLPSQCFVLLL